MQSLHPEAGHLAAIAETFRQDYGRRLGFATEILPVEKDILLKALDKKIRLSADLRKLSRIWQDGIETLAAASDGNRMAEGGRGA